MDQNGPYVSDHIRGDDDEQQQLGLPPGFRFHPTDEELVTHYLSKKVADRGFSTKVIAEVGITKCEPWDLPWRATRVGEKEGYFFCVRDRKYPTGLRTNRATDTGYWKATGKDREIHRGKSLVGMKKTLVFFRGRAPKGEKTDWVMHEYRLHGNCSLYNLPKAAKNEWVICRVCQKSPAATAGCGDWGGGWRMPLDSAPSYGGRLMTDTTALLPPLSGSPFGSAGSTTVRTSPAAAAAAHVTCFSNVVKRHDTQMDIMDCSFNNYCPVFPTASNPSSDVFSSLLLRLLQSRGHVAEGCKAEGEVGGSRSPETGLTNDTNAEISTVPSSHEVGRRQWFGGQEVPTAPSGDTALYDSSGTTRIWRRDL